MDTPSEPVSAEGLAGLTLSRPVKLKYYMFDWDDNVLHMPTCIYLERKTGSGWEKYAVSTGEFARIRHDSEHYRPEDGDWDRAFRDFYDWGDRGDDVFLEDTRQALKDMKEGRRPPAPSFRQFKEALVQGSLFAIISARAHSPMAMLRGVECLVQETFTPAERHTMIRNLRGFIRHFEGTDSEYSDREVLSRYLNICQYWGVSSPEFQDHVGISGPSSASPEHAKKKAIQTFVKHVLTLMRDRGVDTEISVGFSDDDPRNVKAAEDYLREHLSARYPDIKFVVYDTSPSESDPGSSRKIVVTRSDA